MALCFSAVISVPEQASAADTVATWQARFDTVLAANDAANACNTAGNRDADDLSSDGVYCLDALHRMYELTKDTDYLDTMRKYIVNMRASVEDHYSDEYLGWKSASANAEFLRQFAAIIYQWANYIVTVRSDPALDGSHGSLAYVLEEMINTHLIPRWDAYWSEQYGVYLETTSPTTSLDHNHYLYMARALYRMAEVSPRRTAYIARADRMMTVFQSYLSNSGTGYTWNRSDQMTPNDSSSVSTEPWDYAYIALGAAMESYRRGHVFEGADMTRFADGVYDNMWDGSTSDPKLS